MDELRLPFEKVELCLFVNVKLTYRAKKKCTEGRQECVIKSFALRAPTDILVHLVHCFFTVFYCHPHVKQLYVISTQELVLCGLTQ